ncbi:MAG: hypothetical protein SFU86_04300 [Pirellulaceae bacterium]|nr:hypothetical protein [Pirellulaceae bacterium]
MIRKLRWYALALTLAAGTGWAIAQEPEPTLAAPEMLPPTTTLDGAPAAAAPIEGTVKGDGEYAPDGNCPDGNCRPGHGHAGKGHGKLLHREAPYGFYPDGITNYAWKVPAGMYAGAGGCRTCSNGQCQYRFYGQPDLFYNYYAWPSCTGWGAELYLSPRPVPPHVGHTYITYQPLMPHEFLYAHHRTYHRYYNGGQGLNRTSVHYGAPIFRR